MARVELVAEIFEDFDGFFDFFARHKMADVAARIAEIHEAFEILVHSPLIGRMVRDGKRELVIGRGSRGYVALYRYVTDIDTVFVLAIRSQREEGFSREA